jgi:hypothetical protein
MRSSSRRWRHWTGGVDVIEVGGSPVVTVYGREGHARLQRDIERITSKPYVTSIQAEVEGLRGGRRQEL